ncbi:MULTISPECIES: thiamine pyrophosphate-dependent enzyme [Rhodomicrobium]|uniref:thiamine pyrophosphate-dependent enzyme n=1 Tax=Rhodomicrobium TaxID=1068 RepID=UPI000B4B51FB|nr:MULTISPECIES: thiamine pyrophosphate-dependent enzyme [Rhodomicrobium]
MTATKGHAAHVVIDILKSEGVMHIFGNPGSTEMPLMDALAEDDEITYVLGLQEATVIGMADGFALKTGRPAFVNLHSAGGLGNAVGMLYASRTSHTPLVVTAGQQDTRHLFSEPWLSGNLVAIAHPVTKWAAEVTRAEDLPAALRRAFRVARTPPMGPVFLSLPMDVLQREINAPQTNWMLEEVDAAPVPSVKATATYLATRSGDTVAVIVGDDLTPEVAEAVLAFAHVGGYGVYGLQLTSRGGYPPEDMWWRGTLKPDFAYMRDKLSAYQTVILIGSRAFIAYPYRDVEPLVSGTTFIHFADHEQAIDLEAPANISLVGNLRSILYTLADELRGQINRPITADCLGDLDRAADKRTALARAAIGQCDQTPPLTADAAVLAVLDSLPEDTILMNEAAATFGRVQDILPMTPGRYFFARGGVLGSAMPAAVGASFAAPDGIVACLTGDGGAMYSPQALWTAAHYRRHVIFFIFNNARYDVLKNVARQAGYRNAVAGRFIGMDLVDPRIDFRHLAASLGVPAFRVENAETIQSAVKQALLTLGPSLIEIPTR